MEASLFLRNKLYRHIEWNGQEFTFNRYKENEYGELSDEIGQSFTFKGLFHDGGGYGGMMNFELVERDGARITTKMKPMILCTYDSGKDIVIDDWAYVGNNKYKVIEKNNIKNLNIAYELSLELDNDNSRVN